LAVLGLFFALGVLCSHQEPQELAGADWYVATATASIDGCEELERFDRMGFYHLPTNDDEEIFRLEGPELTLDCVWFGEVFTCQAGGTTLTGASEGYSRHISFVGERDRDDLLGSVEIREVCTDAPWCRGEGAQDAGDTADPAIQCISELELIFERVEVNRKRGRAEPDASCTELADAVSIAEGGRPVEVSTVNLERVPVVFDEWTPTGAMHQASQPEWSPTTLPAFSFDAYPGEVYRWHHEDGSCLRIARVGPYGGFYPVGGKR
jgi:hypothetical protein